MSVEPNANSAAYNLFKDSIKNLSTQDLESLYIGKVAGNKARSYMTMATSIALFVLSIFCTLSSFAISIGVCITSIFIGIYSYFQIHKNDYKEK